MDYRVIIPPPEYPSRYLKNCYHYVPVMKEQDWAEETSSMEREDWVQGKGF